MSKLSISVNVEQKAALLRGHVLDSRHLFEVGPEDLGTGLWPILIDRLSLSGEPPYHTTCLSVTGPDLSDLIDALKARQTRQTKEQDEKAAALAKWLTEADAVIAKAVQALDQPLVATRVIVPAAEIQRLGLSPYTHYQGWEAPAVETLPTTWDLHGLPEVEAKQQEFNAILRQLRERVNAVNVPAYTSDIPRLLAEKEQERIKAEQAEVEKQARIAAVAAKRLETGLWERETGSYNQRRYSAPWCARVTFPNGPKPVYEFGESSGKWGEAGIMSVACKPGDVIAYGQKDLRKNNHEHTLLLMLEDGRMQEVNKAEAYKASKPTN